MQPFAACVPSKTSQTKFVHHITEQPARSPWLSKTNLCAPETARQTAAADARTP